jgi:hypothetical protein
MNVIVQNGTPYPTPAMAEAPRAVPTIATSAVAFDMRASPVTIRGQARSEIRRARARERRPRRTRRWPRPSIRKRTGFQSLDTEGLTSDTAGGNEATSLYTTAYILRRTTFVHSE